jgi:hypothetical protein
VRTRGHLYAIAGPAQAASLPPEPRN